MVDEVSDLYRAELGTALRAERFQRVATGRVLSGVRDALTAGPAGDVDPSATGQDTTS